MSNLNILGKERAVIISMIGTKGGIGKTLATANLAAAFADLGLKVLMIDADKQQSLSKHYVVDELAELGFVDFITRSSYQGCISKTEIEGLDIIVNNEMSDEVKQYIAGNVSNRIHQMYLLLHKGGLAEKYDVILIDTAGFEDIGGKQEMAIRASDIALAPIDPQWASAKELLNTISLVRQLEPDGGMVIGNEIPPLYAFFNNVKRTRDNATVVEMFSDREGDMWAEMTAASMVNGKSKLRMLETKIPSREVFNQAVALQQPIHKLFTKSPSDTGVDGVEIMRGLMTEIIPETAKLKFRSLEDN